MNLQGFSPESFEQFIRTLSVQIFGPGITAFGNGPDGGREATFRGRVNYPYPPLTTWDGYGVIQAKFKERLETTERDNAWAATHLRKELQKWQISKKRNPKPDYYIFCTNVDLTSAANGGKETLEKILSEEFPSLNLKDHSIWDSNQLSTYVDSFQEIRRRFTCFFTTGDLLAEISGAFQSKINPEGILTTYLAQELIADQDARLSQAGDRSEDRIRLAAVFTDLPAGRASGSLAAAENDGEESAEPTALRRLLKASAMKLDPLALADMRRGAGPLPTEEPPFGRFVFLGGPGSGKSTIGQFLCQIHRSALLARRPAHQLEEKVRQVIQETKSRCSEDTLLWPTTPRFPFRLELNAFAKALAADGNKRVATLSDYLRRTISRDVAISHEDLQQWLRTFPSILVLDGLDEVPSSSNRRDVIASIQTFLGEARAMESDMMVVATSRLDGYRDEFDGDEVLQLHLLPLSKKRALECAERYVTARWAPRDARRMAEALDTLTAAIDNPLVERLMSSPLQVTFMVTVVFASGKPSDSRWQLFNDYYRTIYERELQKAVRPFDAVLNERRQNIDAIHHRTGFILQCRAELSGGTQADMTTEEFRTVVRKCLEEDGLVGEALDRHLGLIVSAASQRLVFLTSKSVGRLAFDIRSLQEYMAAATLTNADSTVAMNRMGKIAHSAYWRNTLLFAVGRFFVEPQLRIHRDQIRVLCEDLNLEETSRAQVRLGSRLALEILESEIVGDVPLISRSLAKCALQLLSINGDDGDATAYRLSEVCQASSMRNEYVEALRLPLEQRNMTASISAWLLALYLERKGIEWGAELVHASWPSDAKERSSVLLAWVANLVRVLQNGNPLRAQDCQRLADTLSKINSDEIGGEIWGVIRTTDFEVPSWLRAAAMLHSHAVGMDVWIVVAGMRIGLGIRPKSVRRDIDPVTPDAVKELGDLGTLPGSWNCIKTVAEFLNTPNAAVLASCLVTIAKTSEPSDWKRWSWKAPWPLGACLGSSGSKEELLNLAEQAARGMCGDFGEWCATEESWAVSGITVEELTSRLFRSEACLGSAAGGYVYDMTSVAAGPESLLEVQRILENSNDVRANKVVASVLAAFAQFSKGWSRLDPAKLAIHLLPSKRRWMPTEMIVRREDVTGREDEWIALLSELGASDGLRFMRTSWRLGEAPLDWIVDEFCKDQTRTGLLRLAGMWCAAGRSMTRKQVQGIEPSHFTDRKDKLAAVLVRLCCEELDVRDARDLAALLPELLGASSDVDSRNMIVSAIQNHAQKLPALESVLPEVVQSLPRGSSGLMGRIESLRSVLLQSHPSGLDRSALLELGLPCVPE
jgi:hypothetical protein